VPVTILKEMDEFNLEAEQTVLGCLLTNNAYLGDVKDILNTYDFYEKGHRHIYIKIFRDISEGKVVTPVTLKDFAEDMFEVKSLGGAEYLAKIVGKASSVTNVVDYAKVVRGLAVARDGVADDFDMYVMFGVDVDPTIFSSDRMTAKLFAKNSGCGDLYKMTEVE